MADRMQFEPGSESGGAPDVSDATGVLPVANGGTGADLSAAAQNRVLATPDGSSGALALRALVASDVPTLNAAKIGTGTFDAARIPSLPASQVTSGTFDAARIPSLPASQITTGQVATARGGTGTDGSALAQGLFLASPPGSSGGASYRAVSQADLSAAVALPAAVPLVGWWAADRQQVADGGVPWYFLDQGGQGNRLTASVAGGISFSAAGGPNSKPCWVFDGTTYAGNSPIPSVPHGAPALTVSAVVKFNSLTSNPEVCQIGRDHTTNYNSLQSCVLSDGSMYSGGFGGEGNERYTAAGTVVTGTWYLLTWVVAAAAFGSGNPVFRKNGSVVASSGGTGSHVLDIVPDKIRVGGNLEVVAAQLLDGSVAEVVVMSSSAAADVSFVEQYLLAKYAL